MSLINSHCIFCQENLINLGCLELLGNLDGDFSDVYFFLHRANGGNEIGRVSLKHLKDVFQVYSHILENHLHHIMC